MTGDKYHTVVKRQHVKHREMLVLVGAIVTGLALVLGFFLGRTAAYSGMGVDPEIYREMERSLPLMKQKLQSKLDELGGLQVQREVDRAALELVRKEIAVQQDQIANLEEGVRFYKSLMAPEEIAEGLSLRALELMATEASDRFAFRLVAQQEARKHTTLKGSLAIEVYGQLDGELQAYSLADLSEDIEGAAVTLRFRYFQAIEGELVVPAGFVPQGFTVIAKASSPRKVEFQEQFPWELKERFAYAGK